VSTETPDPKAEAQAWLAAFGFKPGVYRHYKGGLYITLAASVHEETLELLVHYYSVERKTRWTRTLTNFGGAVEVNGAMFPRFVLERRPTFEEVLLAALGMTVAVSPGRGVGG
jgi:hypothetical protein